MSMRKTRWEDLLRSSKARGQLPLATCHLPVERSSNSKNFHRRLYNISVTLLITPFSISFSSLPLFSCRCHIFSYFTTYAIIFHLSILITSVLEAVNFDGASASASILWKKISKLPLPLPFDCKIFHSFRFHFKNRKFFFNSFRFQISKIFFNRFRFHIRWHRIASISASTSI